MVSDGSSDLLGGGPAGQEAHRFDGRAVGFGAVGDDHQPVAGQFHGFAGEFEISDEGVAEAFGGSAVFAGFMASQAAAPVTAASFDRRQLATLGPAMLGFFVVALGAQIVNVALPDIGTALGGGLSGLQWLVTGYTLTFSALILFARTLSDRVGARRAYGIGMAVFAVASLVCGLAPGLGTLASSAPWPSSASPPRSA
jgi:Major Facilitator Superfamily